MCIYYSLPTWSCLFYCIRYLMLSSNKRAKEPKFGHGHSTRTRILRMLNALQIEDFRWFSRDTPTPQFHSVCHGIGYRVSLQTNFWTEPARFMIDLIRATVTISNCAHGTPVVFRNREKTRKRCKAVNNMKPKSSVDQQKP